jgi:hypothetical protein
MDRWYAGYFTGALVVLVTLALVDPDYARDAAQLLRRGAGWLDQRAARLELEAMRHVAVPAPAGEGC